MNLHEADLAQCRKLLRNGSRSFHAASFVLPRRMRDSATALYAFCRLADDAIDEGQDAASALRQLTGRLDRIYAGRPDDCPADRAFAAIVARFEIPHALPQALLDGFRFDAEARRYETLEDLCGYAARVAGSVGVMMTLLMERREPAVLARASDLGVAMQLTNIARDVGDDARAGRLYLPLRWLREAGIDPDAFMREPKLSPGIAAVIERLLAAAQALYDRSAPGIAHLPAGCRVGIHAARTLYSGIGREVARRRFDSISQRAVMPLHAKCMALGVAIASLLKGPGFLPDAALPETQFLIDAVRPALRKRDTLALAPARWDLVARMVWLIDLFERLERRDQFKRADGRPQ